MANEIPGGWDKGELVHANLKCVDGPGTSVDVKFNPKELTIDKPVPWQKHKNVEGDEPTLEFTAAEPKTMNCELMFDLYEDRGDVYAEYIEPLETMALIDSTLKRPPLLLFTWGGMPQFQGVIEDLNVKYTLFLPDGTPCRATVNLKMKQASALMNKAEAEEANKKAAQQQQASTTTNAANTSTSGSQATSTMNNQTAQGAPPGPTGAPQPGGH